MLTGSAGFADLEQLSTIALGGVTLHVKQPFRLTQLLELYGTSFSLTQDGLEADLPEEALQIALGTEAEAAADRFTRQLATYDSLSGNGKDPLWTAVTAYYAAFFVANSLMLACGGGFVNINPSVVSAAKSRGIYSVRVRPASGAAQLNLVLNEVDKSSHQATWRELRRLVDFLSHVAGNGPREAHAFTALSALIARPAWLSHARNQINYDFALDPFQASLWPRELPHLLDEEAVQQRVLTILAPRAEQRFELVIASCASLLSGLFRGFARRGGKMDPQRKQRRLDCIAACPHLAWLMM
jgi:hypothetical protein